MVALFNFPNGWREEYKDSFDQSNTHIIKNQIGYFMHQAVREFVEYN